MFTISGPSRAFTALRLIDIVTASHSHMNELATLEFGLQQLARLGGRLAPDGALPGPLMLALSSRTRIGTVERRMPLRRQRCRLKRSPPHRDADRDHHRLSPSGRTMATTAFKRNARVFVRK